MKKIAIILITALFISGPLAAFAAPDEQAFLDSYKKAFEGKDEKTLESFLYTEGADPGALEFYKMMMTGDAGAKIKSMKLVALTPDELKEATSVQEMPDGQNAKLPVAPSKKLVMEIEMSDANGTSTSHSESLVAEVNGKYMIPVPGPVK